MIDTSTTQYAESQVVLAIGSNQREWWTDGDIVEATHLDAYRVRAAIRDLSHSDNRYIHSRGIGEAKGWKLSERGRSYLADATPVKRIRP